jgi:hypothetical protein
MIACGGISRIVVITAIWMVEQGLVERHDRDPRYTPYNLQLKS